MKFRLVVSFLLVAMLAVLATAQNQSDATKHDADTQDALSIIKIATDVAGNVQGHAMNGYLAIYLDQKTWASGLNDGDLGPFLKVKEAKPGRSVACLYSQNKDTATCVYFDSGTPFGVVSILADASGKIDPSTIPAAYKAVSKDMLKKRDDGLHFTLNSSVASDDGQALTAYVVTGAAKSTK
jgi:hypothetical protein